MAEAKSSNLLKILAETQKFEIPIYQREYTWSKEKCTIFFNDILEEYSNYDPNNPFSERFGYNVWNKYYIGNIVYLSHDNEKTKVIVDGQQRITTTILFLTSLIAASKELTNNPKYQNIIRENGIRPLNENDFRFIERLIKNEKDNFVKMNYSSINKGEELNELVSKSVAINENSKYYENFLELKNWIITTSIAHTYLLNEGSLQTFYRMLEHTVISNVIISNDENPTKIFEKINNTSSRLTVSDLIRNALFFESYRETFQPFIPELDKGYAEFESYIKDISEVGDKHVKGFDLNSFFRYYNIIVGNTNRLANEDGDEVYSDFRYSLDSKRLGEIEYVKSIIDQLTLHARISNYILLYQPTNNKDDILYNSIKRVMFSFYTIIHSFLYEAYKDFKENNKIAKITDYIRMQCRTDFMQIITICNELLYSMLIAGVQLKNITRGMSALYANYVKARNEIDSSLSFRSFLKNKSRYTNNEENLQILSIEDLKVAARTTKLGTSGKATSTSLLYLIESGLGGFNKTYEELEKNYKRYIIIDKNQSYDSRFAAADQNIFSYQDMLSSNYDLLGNYTLFKSKVKDPNFSELISSDNSLYISDTISNSFKVTDITKRTDALIELYWQFINE